MGLEMKTINERHSRALERLLAHEAFVAGGAIRDIFLGLPVLDLDIVVPKGAVAVAKGLARHSSGTLVPLDKGHGVARVILEDGFSVDFSEFRDGANTIFEDLERRDFTVNAMALPLRAFLLGDLKKGLLDPTGGRKDLERHLLRACGQDTFFQDPLRVFRAFRFMAELGFEIEPRTKKLIKKYQTKGDFASIASERISYELNRTLAQGNAYRAFMEMARLGTLFLIIPELKGAIGVDQPGFHHLDVFGHCMETLKMAEKVIRSPSRYLSPEPVESWLNGYKERIIALKWASLLHDIGKPRTKAMKGERATFYNHDKEGADMVRAVARRLRWSNTMKELVVRLVALHMRPFHLLNDLRLGGPTPRAMRRLIDAMGPDYPGLFVLAMADTLAGCGPLKPEGLEEEISTLFGRVHEFWEETLRPIRTKRRLLNGVEVMEQLQIPQGPLVGSALNALEEAQCDGLVKDKEDAIAYLKDWLKEQGRDATTVSHS